MKLEEVTKIKINKVSNSGLYALRLRAIQLHEKYSEIEKREPLIGVDWDSFYKNYKLLTNEFNKRRLNFTRRSIDKILEKAKYFGVKIIEKQDASSTGKCFAMLAQIGQSNIIIDPTIKKEYIKEPINGIIITKSVSDDLERIRDYSEKIPVYAIGKAFDKINFHEKHLFLKSLSIRDNQVLIRPIKITYKKKNPEIGLRINKKDTKLSILPEFLSLTKSTKDLIKETVWICKIFRYDKNDEERESLSFLSLIKMAKELKPKKIFIVNADEDLLRFKEEINQELKKWQGRMLFDGDTLEEDEIMRGLVWELNESEKSIFSLDRVGNIAKFEKDKAVIEVNFNGVRARVEKKDKDVIIMVNPNRIEGSPLQSKKLPLQVDEIQSFRDDFVGEATIIVADDERNECLGEEVVKGFLKSRIDSEEINKKVHIFISDLLQLNGRNVEEWTLEKRKKIMNYFGNREHVHFVKSILDIEKNSLSYIINIGDKKELEKVFESIIKVSDEGKFYPKNIAKSIIVKSLYSPYSTERIVISKPETTANYHRIPVTDCKITATITISESKGIKALYCGGEKKIATYLFDVDKFTMATAQEWLKTHLKKAQHKSTECMECSKTPVYECLWAEGIGHAWFCKEHLKEWATNGDGRGEIISVKEVQNGEAAKKFGDNTNPNIIKELIKQDEVFECECVDCGYKMKSVVHCINIKCKICGGQMRRVGRPGSGKPEEHLNKSEVKFEFKKIGKEPEYIVGGVAYFSNQLDSQNHFARQGAVWEAMKDYMINKRNIKIMHKGEARNVKIVESYFVENEHLKGGTSKEHLLHKGDFWLSVYLGDSENRDIWQAVKNGTLTGFSIAGRAKMTEGHI